MPGRPIRIVDPAELPVTLDEVKGHLRIPDPGNTGFADALVLDCIKEAVDWLDGFDRYLGRGIVAQTWAVPLFDGETSIEPIFPDARNCQVQREVSGVWTVEPGATAELQSDGSVRLSGLPDDMTGVALTMETGWVDAQAVPGAIKRAIKLLVGQWYELTSGVADRAYVEMPYSVRDLLAPFRVQVPL